MSIRSLCVVTLCVSSLMAASLAACTDKPQPRPPAPSTPPAGQHPKQGPAPADAPKDGASASSAGSAAAPRPSFVAPPAGGWTVSGQNDDPKSLEVGGIRAPKPTTWIWQQPTVQFRTLQYSVPAQKESTGAAELVVSFFEGNDAGGLEPNLKRWRGQFKGADGQPATPIESNKQVDGLNVHLIELSGTYSGMSGSGPMADQLQLGAIVMAPGGAVFIRLVGPKAVVEGERANFNALIDGIARSTN